MPDGVDGHQNEGDRSRRCTRSAERRRRQDSRGGSGGAAPIVNCGCRAITTMELSKEAIVQTLKNTLQAAGQQSTDALQSGAAYVAPGVITHDGTVGQRPAWSRRAAAAASRRHRSPPRPHPHMPYAMQEPVQPLVIFLLGISHAKPDAEITHGRWDRAVSSTHRAAVPRCRAAVLPPRCRTTQPRALLRLHCSASLGPWRSCRLGSVHGTWKNWVQSSCLHGAASAASQLWRSSSAAASWRCCRPAAWACTAGMLRRTSA